MPQPTVFLSYSHQDEVWKKRISSHLQVPGELEIWDDRQIALGEDWLPAIEAALERAVIAVLVVSDAFLTSNFILRQEIPRLLERRREGGLLVLPVIARPCAWKAVEWLARIQCYPKDGRALSQVRKSRVDQDLAELALKVRQLRPVSPSPAPRQEEAGIPTGLAAGFPRAQLRQSLTEQLSNAELKTIVYDLDIDWEDLPGETKSERVVELLRRMERRKETERLLAAIERHRPGFRNGLSSPR